MGYKKNVPDSVATRADTGNGCNSVGKGNGEVLPTDIVSNGAKKVNSKNKCANGKKRAAERKRNFATVIYPDSAPEDWKERISDMHVAALISPLHSDDINPDGSVKKPHYHIMFMFEGPKDFDSQVKPMFDAIGGVGREMVNSMRGYARYLCHLDNPEKHQYDVADVLQMGGADYAATIHLPTDDSRMLSEIFTYIKLNQIYSLAEMIDICAVNNQDWFNLITMSRAYIVDKYIKSLCWESNVGYTRTSDLKAAEQAAELEEARQQEKVMSDEVSDKVSDEVSDKVSDEASNGVMEKKASEKVTSVDDEEWDSLVDFYIAPDGEK